MKNPICPACKKVIGLYNKEGKLIGCEYHYVTKHERTLEIVPFSQGFMFRVEQGLICNRMEA